VAASRHSRIVRRTEASATGWRKIKRKGADPLMMEEVMTGLAMASRMSMAHPTADTMLI
jgi:hypothetical protein